jgi:TonB-dependent receptor
MIIKRPLITIIIILCSSIIACAQYGSIKGTVKDKKTGETIVGASIIIKDTQIGITSDLDGNYEIKNLTPGSYTINISYISYKAESFKNITVTNGKATELNIEIESEVVTIKSLVVKGSKKTDTEISMIATIKASSLVTSGVSSQQILKMQDRDASEVIKRVPGITVIEDRFAVVRGLNERYNSVILNNVLAPSSETDVRAFSFDVIPSSLLEKLIIYKTPAPELPGDFAGGVIAITTKNTPDKNFLSASYSDSYRTCTTFKDFYSNTKGKTDWLGYDDGTRNLPSGFPANLQDITTNTQEGKDLITQLGRSLNKDWTAVSEKAGLDQRFSVAGGIKINIGKNILSNITSINYSNTSSFKNIFRTYYLQYDTAAEKADTSWRYNDAQYTNTAKIGILHNWSLTFGNKQKLEFRNFFNQQGSEITTLRSGRDFDNLQTLIKSSQFQYTQKTTYIGQLGGQHSFNDDKTKFDWTVGYAYAKRDEPDIKRVTFALDNNDPELPTYNKYFMLLSNNADPRFAGRVFLNSNENTLSLNMNYEHKISSGSFKPTIKAGFYGEDKQREFKARLLGYKTAPATNWSFAYQPVDTIFADHNINTTNGIVLAEKTNPSDSYNAADILLAGYAAANLPVGARINIYTGLRVEKNKETLNSFSSDFSKKPVTEEINKTNFFPSLNATYSIKEKSLVRLAYGRTINRPEFREMAPFAYYEYQQAATIYGNPKISDASIDNFEMRYEYYPTASEIFTAGIFYKYFKNPIETIIPNAGSDLAFTYENAWKANSTGVEAELRKSFSSCKKKSGLNFLKDFSVIFNGAYIVNTVYFKAEQATAKKDRSMQGQSPYILNTGIFYQNDKAGLQANVVFNIFGKRIVYVGSVDIPDVYEMPHPLLDFSFSKKIGKYIQVKGGIQDILNRPFEYRQFVTFNKDTNGDGIGDTKVTNSQTTLSYRKGKYFTLGISISL